MDMSNYSGSLVGLINNFPTANRKGFTTPEIDDLLKSFPNIDVSLFDDELVGNTIIADDGEHINLKSDVLKALEIGIDDSKKYKQNIEDKWCNYSGMPSPKAYG